MWVVVPFGNYEIASNGDVEKFYAQLPFLFFWNTRATRVTPTIPNTSQYP